MRYFSALCARMYRLSANSRATISSTAIFLSQQSRQYRSSPRGSETSFAPHSAHRAWTTVLRDILQLYYVDCGLEIGDCVAIDLLRLRLSLHDRTVHVFRVLLDHSPRAEARRHAEHRLAHHVKPPPRDAFRVPIVVGRNHFLLEQLIERFGVRRVDGVEVGRLRVTLDQPAIATGEALGPPSIADADVRHSVNRCFHAARAAGFQWFAWIVQPDVAALHQEVSHVQIVVVDERDPSGEHRVGRSLVDLLKMVLT